MEMEGPQKTDLEFKGHRRVDNNQFSGNQVDLTTHASAEGLSAQKEVDIILGIDADDQLSQLHESKEPEQTKTNRRYNLRKSLAWDTAFFTSAGVLDAEELSNMITGADKGEKQSLPGIQEDITGSSESIPTLESDDLNLETLEEDLFVDIRASIQRSSKKTPNSMDSSNKKATVELNSASISPLRKEGGLASPHKNPKSGSKKTSGLQAVGMSKSLPKQYVGKPGYTKAIKQASGHLQMTSVANVGEKNSFHTKTPKTVSNFISTSTTAKRASVGTVSGKSESGSSKLGAPATVSSKGTQPPKVSGGAIRMLPRPAVSSKSSLSGSSATGGVRPAKSSTSGDSLSSLSSGAPVKSLVGRKIPSRSGNAGSIPSGSIPKTQSKGALKNNPSPSTKISSSVSPASSISECSSVSSSSSIVNRKLSNSRTSIDSCSSRSIDDDITLRQSRSSNQTDRCENQGAVLPSNSSKKSSTTGIVQASAKPSGLRMPSPKIGFFDGVKPSARTPNGHQQPPSGLRSGIPKNGVAASSPIQSSNSKLKGSKVSKARMVTSLASTKPDSPKATSPTSSPKKQHPSNASSVSSDVTDSSRSSLVVKCNATGEGREKAEKVPADDEVKQVVDAGTGTTKKGNLGDWYKGMDPSMHNSMDNGGTKSYVDSNISGLECVDLIDTGSSQKGLEKYSHPACEAIGKENACDSGVL